jgi:uncharacterized membrane protein/mono/diheme cytochrome c family protein
MRFFSPSRALFFLALVGISGVVETCVRGEDVAVSRDEALKTAAEVREIFEAKCVDCHGPELPRPKGKFGYVLDLKRVADNPKYIVRGQPEESDLYDMVLHNDMPGEDANVPPLTDSEKATVRHWIMIGAPAEMPLAKEKELPAVILDLGKPPLTLGQHALKWLGNFHPVSTHFPVALMMVAVVAEALAWMTRRPAWLQTVRFLVIIAALGAVPAAALGWANAAFSSYNKAPLALLWWHRWLGTAAAIWAAICAALVLVSECQEGSPQRQRFRGALLVGALLVSVSGFLGSALIYGLNHYAWD